MINISDKSMCSGCTACVNICPVQCIVMRRDRQEGFDYPVANPDICIGCGRCEAVCPVLNPMETVKPLKAYAVRCDEYVDGSSSGGVFPALAKEVIDDGGVVFGAVVESDMKVGHAEAETMAEVEKMRGSKYVQSDLYSVFQDIRAYLDDGRKVLFTGTPCQVAGLRRYLGGHADGLWAVDVACHGVPSPGLWEMYVKVLENRVGGKMTSVNFRDKSKGWRRYVFKTSYDADKDLTVRASDDPYMALFMQDMTLRPSCYTCRFRNGGSGSDLTLADLWSVAETAPAMNDDKGVSGVLVSTQTGAEMLGRISVGACLELPPDAVKKANGGFAQAVAVPERREEFFAGLGVVGVDVYGHMSSYVKRKPLSKRMWLSLRSMLSSVKRRMTR